jgi:hypothetical protein
MHCEQALSVVYGTVSHERDRTGGLLPLHRWTPVCHMHSQEVELEKGAGSMTWRLVPLVCFVGLLLFHGFSLATGWPPPYPSSVLHRAGARISNKALWVCPDIVRLSCALLHQ